MGSNLRGGTVEPEEQIRCPLCGTEFNADEHARCSACPLGSNCYLICCPNCGYQMVDERKSVLARLARRLRPAATRPPRGEA
ncbi:MAG: hypothetical protein IT330_01415 [Anaerolineae bacterium]|nr:hypothetical protein [Anaerolineae bacterium]